MKYKASQDWQYIAQIGVLSDLVRHAEKALKTIRDRNASHFEWDYQEMRSEDWDTARKALDFMEKVNPEGFYIR